MDYGRTMEMGELLYSPPIIRTNLTSLNMSYCTMYGFKQLASTYLDINRDHQLYGEVEPLFEKAEVTLRGVVELLEEKTNELENAISM